MKLFKRIYFSAIAGLFVLLLVFTVFDVGGRKVSGDFSVNAAEGYLRALAKSADDEKAPQSLNNPHSFYDDLRHKEVIRTLRISLNNTGVKHNPDNSTYNFDFIGKHVPETHSKTPKGDAIWDRPTDSDFTGIVNYNYESADLDGTSISYTGVATDAKFNAGNAPAWYEQDGYLSYDDLIKYAPDFDCGDSVSVTWPLRLRNFIVVFPAANPAAAQTVLYMAHYDSAMTGTGARDDLASAACMLSVIEWMVKNPKSYNNNIAFVFTDGAENGAYGAALSRKFLGFGEVLQRVGFVANFESFGTKGTSVMFETNTKNAGTVKNYAKINNSTYTNSLANFIYSLSSNHTDYSVYKGDGTPGMNFANVGGGENNHTVGDNLSNSVSKSGLRFMSQHGGIMLRILGRFGDMNLNDLKSGQNAVFFNYLFFTIHYPEFASYIIGALIVGILIFAVMANIKKKAFSFKKMGLGAAAQGIAVVLSAIAVAGVYYLFALWGAAWGTVSIRAIAVLAFSSPFLVFCALTAAMLFSAIFINIFKNAFKVRANDVAVGSAVILAVIAAGLAFALPEVSFLLGWLALLEAAVLAFTVVFKDKFKDKFGYSMERLFLPWIPLVLCLPIILPSVLLAGDVFGAWLYPAVMVVPLLCMGFVTPYFSYIKPAMEKAFAKLPPIKRKQEVVREETPEEIRARKKAAAMARAKGRKVVVKTQKEIKIVTRQRRYSNALGFTFISLILVVVLMIAVPIGIAQTKFTRNNYAYARDFYFGYYDNALVYVKSETDPNGNYWMVKDKDAYLVMSSYLEDYNWDGEKGGWVKYDSKGYSYPSGWVWSRPDTNTNSATDKYNTDNPNHFKFRFTPVFRGSSTYHSTAYNTSSYNTMYTLTIDNEGGDIQRIILEENPSGKLPHAAQPMKQEIDVADKSEIVLRLTYDVDVTFITNGGSFDKTVEYREYAANTNVEAELIKFSRFDDAKQETMFEYGELRFAKGNDALRNSASDTVLSDLMRRGCYVRGAVVVEKTLNLKWPA